MKLSFNFTLLINYKQSAPNPIPSDVSLSLSRTLLSPPHIPIQEHLHLPKRHNPNLTASMSSPIPPLHLLSPSTAPRPAAAQSPKPNFFGFRQQRSSSRIVSVSAFGDVSADSNIYLFAGAAAVALIGTAFPIFFSRKDLCPECDGAGFIRETGSRLRANAARKDQSQIVCPRCNGLGKLGQIDKLK